MRIRGLISKVRPLVTYRTTLQTMFCFSVVLELFSLSSYLLCTHQNMFDLWRNPFLFVKPFQSSPASFDGSHLWQLGSFRIIVVWVSVCPLHKRRILASSRYVTKLPPFVYTCFVMDPQVFAHSASTYWAFARCHLGFLKCYEQEGPGGKSSFTWEWE